MRNVARVIRQRMLERGMSARQVCLQRYQFSCWNPPRNKFSSHKHLFSTRHANTASRLARDLLKGNIKPSTIGSPNHYLSKRLKRWPRWAYVDGRKRKPVHGDGYHLFFRLPTVKRAGNK